MRQFAPILLLLACAVPETEAAPFAPPAPDGGITNPCGSAENDLQDLSDEEYEALEGEIGGFSCDWKPGDTVHTTRPGVWPNCEVAWWECGPC
jgi:hypothetical protein